MFGFFRKKKQPTGAELAEEGLRVVAMAIKNKHISVDEGNIFDDIYVHADMPNNIPRFTYVMFSDKSNKYVIARCAIVFNKADTTNTIWQIDWAVAENYRSKGIATSLVEKSLVEFESGMRGKFPHGIIIEAVVDTENTRRFLDPSATLLMS